VSTCQTLLDDLNDRLNDASNTQMSEAAKIRALNQGLRAMWPYVYRITRDTTLALVADTYEYVLPAGVAHPALLLRVEVETSALTNRFVEFNDFDVVPGEAGTQVMVFRHGLPSAATATVRLTAAKRLSEFTVAADAFDGPAGTEELPVLYAMSIATSRELDDRLDYTRYSTTQAMNSVTNQDVSTSSDFWMQQFERRLGELSMPFPVLGAY
jgi:hypothetical protein